jgi:NAD(P)-dependent dehydrogenase (short-subunit alcohol dehydrogenase family)
MGIKDFSLEGKTAIVTGAAGVRGIGRAIALALAEAGADVAVCDISVSGKDFDLEGTAEEVRKLGRRSLAVKADISDEEQVDSLVDTVTGEFGKIDIMVNNAAAGATVTWQDVTRAQWERLLHTNIIGCHNCCRAAGRVMIQQKRGSIINISSSTGSQAAPIFYAYGVSKAGINQITRALAPELSPHGVRINAVAPGAIETDISSHDIVNPIPADDRFGPGQGTPPGVGKPSGIADIVLFLASDASRYLTGQVLLATGETG